MPKLTVAIPTHSMENGKFFLKRCFESLWNQSFQDFEIVVTDNSDDDVLKEVCDWYKTGIRYFKNPRKGMAQNTNEAIKKSKGSLIKILYMDDFLAHDEALNNIVSHFKGEWLATSCTHVLGEEDERFNSHHAKYSDDIHTGHNTIGSPSVLTIKNHREPLLFDEEMTWLLDCDYYKRLYDIYGPPTIISDINVVIGLHEGQQTHLMGEDRKIQEQKYIRQKYA